MSRIASDDTPEILAAQIGPLHLGAHRRAIARIHGEHARRRAGTGTEFWQFRPLRSGESSARIDWRRSARSDSVFVREREEESPKRLVLWRDGSGSMDFRSGESLPTKAARADAILAALGLAAADAGEAVSVLDAPETRATLDERLSQSKSAAVPLDAFAASDIPVIAGDFLEPDLLGALSDTPAGILLKLVDPAEADFSYSGRVYFRASEDGDPEADVGRGEELAPKYRAAWEDHLAGLSEMAAASGWDLVIHRTDAPALSAIDALADLLREVR